MERSIGKHPYWCFGSVRAASTSVGGKVIEKNGVSPFKESERGGEIWGRRNRGTSRGKNVRSPEERRGREVASEGGKERGRK